MAESPAALVTGASSGIGRATVALLVERRWRVFAGVRHEGAAADLRQDFGPAVTPLLLDVTKEDHIAAAAARIESECPGGLRGVVNNAGLGLPAPLELAPLDEIRAQIEVNSLGPLRVIQTLLPALRRGQGRIVNISSMNGTTSLPMVGGYSASKFALEAISAALRVELKPWRIPVSVIRPGQVRTPIFTKARTCIAAAAQRVPADLAAGYAVPLARTAKMNERGATSLTSPEAVARVVLRALEARWPRAHYVVGWDARGLAVAHALMPTRLWDRTLARVMGSLRLRPGAVVDRTCGATASDDSANEPTVRPLAPSAFTHTS